MEFVQKVRKKIMLSLLNTRNTMIGNHSEFDFFAIRGYPKSGTNWLSNLMNLHPEIISRGEFALNRFAVVKETIREEVKWSICNSPQLSASFDRYFEDFIKKTLVTNARFETSLKGVKQIGDKTPTKAYPPTIESSKCLYIIRDVRDVTVSRAYHLMRVNGTWGLNQFPKMMEMMDTHGGNLQFFKRNPKELLQDTDWVLDNVRSWAKAVSQVLDAKTNGWQSKFPNYDIKAVYYEDLHMNVEKERQECYRFLGLDPLLANPLDSGKMKTSAGFDTERPQQFYRKGEIGDWKNYFSEELHQLVVKEIGGVMDQAGYLD